MLRLILNNYIILTYFVQRIQAKQKCSGVNLTAGFDITNIYKIIKKIKISIDIVCVMC